MTTNAASAGSLQARNLMLPELAALAAQAAGAAEAARLGEAAADLPAGGGPGRAFHLAVLHATRNAALIRALDRLMEARHEGWTAAGARGVAAAIAAGEPDAARRAMRAALRAAGAMEAQAAGPPAQRAAS